MEKFVQFTNPYWFFSPQIFILFLVVILSFGFLINFILPALSLKKNLEESIKKLRFIKHESNGHPVDLHEIGKEAMKTPDLAHSWIEYTKTLHPQKEISAEGQSKISCWRATAMAEAFFVESMIVSRPLQANYYKHLPGILTGLGIIGTFYGLIKGLSTFDISDPAKAQSELNHLINTVGDAFFVSVTAIAAAMLITWLEKSILAKRNRQLADLWQIIDSLFEAGAAEEYLARIANSSETQATQAAHIKDALVADLKEILTTLAEKQSDNLGKAIAEHLGSPITAISDAVKNVSVNQGDAVNKMLTDVLASFSTQMQEMFGGQMQGMTDLLNETSDIMKQSAMQFTRLTENMNTASNEAVSAMGEKLSSVIQIMEERQQTLNDQMTDFTNQIKDLIEQSQTDSAIKLQESLGLIGAQTAELITQLRQQAEDADQRQQKREKIFETSTGEAVKTLSSTIEELLARSVETNAKLENTISQLTKTTSETIISMNSGAERLLHAADKFSEAGNSVSKTMNHASQATTDLKATTEALSTTTEVTKQIISDYEKTKDSFRAMVAELKHVSENTRKDAKLTAELFEGIEKRQHEMNQQMDKFVTSLQKIMSDLQTTSAQNLKDSLDHIGTQMTSLINSLKLQVKKTADGQQKSREITDEAVKQLMNEVQLLLQKTVETNDTLQKSVEALSKVTTDAINNMSSGANKLQIAASDFAKAGDKVGVAMTQAEETTAKLMETSGVLSITAGATKDIFASYENTTKTLNALAIEIKVVLENARKDASLTSEIISGIESAAEKLGEAQLDAKQYLQDVSDVLEKTHEKFGEMVGETLSDYNKKFLNQFEKTVELLKGTIENLDDTFDKIPKWNQ